mmetsp:Transcript_134879/g.419098  ORF Transcript_134879/g.419098 Transcript_134879/m.419098 type:complete len:112 (-) Transcript_134879:40-375(-)
MKGLAKTPDLELLLFPCGQFGNQELNSAGEIQDFVKSKGLDLPNVHIMAKGDLKGPKANPAWKFMKEAAGASDPEWNFTGKFLVSKAGEVGVPSGKDLKSLKTDIEGLLAK